MCSVYTPSREISRWHKDPDFFYLKHPFLVEGDDFVYAGKRSHLAPPAPGMEGLARPDSAPLLVLRGCQSPCRVERSPAAVLTPGVRMSPWLVTSAVAMGDMSCHTPPPPPTGYGVAVKWRLSPRGRWLLSHLHPKGPGWGPMSYPGSWRAGMHYLG